MLTDNDLKNYIKGYIANRKITYTKLDKHDRAIEVLINENKKLKKIIFEARKMIFDNYGVLDKYGIELLDDILKGSDK